MKKILLAEDEKNIVLTVKICLERAGYEVTVARDGVQALELAMERDWDLILLDLRLPRVDGFLVCEALARENLLEKIPVVVISALSREEDKERVEQLGIKDFIVKPIEAEELVSRIKAQLKEVDKQ